jgi:hypothetical protein
MWEGGGGGMSLSHRASGIWISTGHSRGHVFSCCTQAGKQGSVQHEKTGLDGGGRSDGVWIVGDVGCCHNEPRVPQQGGGREKGQDNQGGGKGMAHTRLCHYV